MAFKIVYGPNASLVGQVAQQAGLAKFDEAARQAKLQEAHEMAGQMRDQANFMANQQQRAVENQMRGAQMAEGAMKDRAEFGLRSQQADFGNLMQQARGYADYENQQQQFGLRERQFEYGQERDQAHEQMLRDFEGGRREDTAEGRDLRERLAEQQQKHQLELEAEKAQHAFERTSLRFTPDQNKQLATIDKNIAGVQSMIEAAGPLGAQPSLQRELAKLQGQRDYITKEAKTATVADEAAQEQARQKQIEARQTTINGVPHIIDQHGVPQPSKAWELDQKHRNDFYTKFTKANVDKVPTAADYQAYQRFMSGAPDEEGGGNWAGQAMVGAAQAIQGGLDAIKADPQSGTLRDLFPAAQAIAQEVGPQAAKQAADILATPKDQRPDFSSLPQPLQKAVQALIEEKRRQKAGNLQSAAPSSRGLRLHGVRIPDIGPSTAPEMLGSDALG